MVRVHGERVEVEGAQQQRGGELFDDVDEDEHHCRQDTSLYSRQENPHERRGGRGAQDARATLERRSDSVEGGLEAL